MENKPKDTRLERRLKEKIQKLLDGLVMDFLMRRSAEKDPDGEEVAKLYEVYQTAWITKCKNHNRLARVPFKLKYEAFAESVDYFLKEEKKKKAEAKEAKQANDFNSWYRKLHPWRTRSLNMLYFWFTTWGDKEKIKQLWKNYYCKEILNKND
jgi:hypothetical protein